eukprot:CAMPEP_0177661862 /NCGR_PEP_ID=MMETSP0447-20121125/18944_1 /TAXON_ID=0 /ORGANISM="Stygamoeba regulata, Strain BSH-02190019" /LENGTH=517 /DNA_ID=CAMNT_0019167311 /DNA_START=14 /DNA_END=1567 /DNA_ORIENTATION=-
MGQNPSVVKQVRDIIRYDQHERLDELLARHPGAASAVKDGVPMVVMAAYYMSPECCAVLLKHGADPNSMNQCHFGGLAFATQRGCERSAHVLLESGALVDQTSMQNAVHHGMHRTLEHMLSAEARMPDGQRPDANQLTDGGAPLLLLAACRGHTACLRVLIAHGANIDAVNTRGATALAFATKKRHSSAALFLLEHGASVDRNALHNTVRNGMRRVLAKMLELGADPNTKTNRGAPLLAVAAGWQHLACCELLLDAGADVNAVNSMGSSALSFAVSRDEPDIVRLLLEHGARLNLRLSNPLYIAVKSNNLHIVEMLVSLGADPNPPLVLDDPAVQTSSSSSSPLLCSSVVSSLACTSALSVAASRSLASSCLSTTSSSRSAASSSHSRTSSSSHSPPSSSHSPPSSSHSPPSSSSAFHIHTPSESPLHLAATNDYRSIAVLLAKHGADLYARDTLGRTPLEVCVNPDLAAELARFAHSAPSLYRLALRLVSCYLPESPSLRKLLPRDVLDDVDSYLA